jgi:hypothetical protein
VRDGHGNGNAMGPVAFPIYSSDFFIFIFFNFIFYKNIFCFRNLQEYTPAAPLPGSRGFSAKSFAENLRPVL